MLYNNVNLKLVDKLLELKKDSGSTEEIFTGYEENEIRKVYAFYIFGRSIIDGSLDKTKSFDNFCKETEVFNRKQLIDKLTKGILYYILESSFHSAKNKYEEHENNVLNEKNKCEKRLKNYEKKEPYYIQLNNSKVVNSTSKIFQTEFSKLALNYTNDIEIAKEIIQNIITKTDGNVVVDFLGVENFDRLQFVESDDEVLKLYWHYSMGVANPPHNIRVDIAFDKLELIKLNDNDIAIGIKGYYKSKNEIKSYYHNKERISNMNSKCESKGSLFYYELDFDKIQRNSKENFRVTFLPWRYYNILILPRENLPSAGESSEILILKNLLDIKNKNKKIVSEFERCKNNDEDTIAMFGNRYRKTMEELLKFIILTCEVDFKENYKDDMFGSLLSQLKKIDKDYEIQRYSHEYLQMIIDKIEDKGFIKKYNVCSHYNVDTRIYNEILNNMYEELSDIITLCFKYFNLAKYD